MSLLMLLPDTVKLGNKILSPSTKVCAPGSPIVRLDPVNVTVERLSRFINPVLKSTENVSPTLKFPL